MEILLEKLNKSEVFGKIKHNDLEELGRSAIHRRLAEGQYLSHQDDNWPFVLFVESGELIWAMISLAGKEKILFTIKQGEDFWAHTIFDGKPLPASLQAIEETEVYIWPSETILPVMYRNPEAMWAITGRLVGIMRHAREIIYGLAFQPVSARLAHLFLDRFYTDNDHQTERDLTLEQIAAMISSTPQVVCKVMYQFQEEGILKVSRATIKLEDIEALRQLSETY